MKTPPFFVSRKIRKKRSGVSAVISTTIIIAITVTLGLALWGFANSGVGTATTKYSQAVDAYGDIIRYHRYVIANVDFDNPAAIPPRNVAFWIYNSGKLNTTISENLVIITCKDCDPKFIDNPTGLTQVSPDDPSQPLTVFPKSLKKFYFDSGDTLQLGKTYELTVVSDAGLTQTFIKRME